MSKKTGQNGDSPAFHQISLDISVGQDMDLPDFFGHLTRYLWTYCPVFWTNHCHKWRFARNFWTYRIEQQVIMGLLHYVQKNKKAKRKSCTVHRSGLK